MAKLNFKEISEMAKSERETKLKELKLELMKSKTAGEKQGGSKSKHIRKIIARILTIKNREEKK